MAEIGSLAVSLTMDATNFNGSITQVDRNLKAMGGELQAIRAQGADYGKSVEGLSQKQDVLQRSLTASSVKLQEQRKKYDEMVASGNASEAALEKQALAVNRAQAQYNKFQTELDQVTVELNNLQDVSKKAERAMSELGEKTAVAGGKLKDVGGTLTASVTAPLLAFGAGAITVATQFDTAQARIQGQLGLTAQEAENLAQVAQKVWKKGFGEDIGQVTTDLSTLKQYIKDVGDEELSTLLEAGYTLQELFGAEIQETARTASVIMKTFGVDGQEAMDLITVAFQRGGDFSGELLDTFREYSPQFKALGYDAEGFTSVLIAGAEAGAFNLDKIGDAAKESFLRIGDGSKSSREALSDLGLNFQQIEKDINSGGETANSAFAAVASAIALVKDPAEKSALAIALMGTPIEDLGPEFQNFFANVETELGNFEGAASKAGETLQQSFGERLQSTWRTTQEGLLPLGEALLDIAEDHLPKVIDTVESAAKWFSNLSPKAQEVALAIGGIAVVAGPAVATLGMFTAGIGGILTASAPLVGTLAGASSGVGLLGSALALVTGPVGLTAAGIVGLGTAAVIVGKEMGESSIQIEDWSNKVSESTVKAVGGFMILSDEASLSLNQLAWSGQTITQEMATEMIALYDQMGQQVLTEMQNDHAAQLEELTVYYANTSALTEEEEAEILARMKEKQLAKEVVVNEGNSRIKEIWETASQEKRGITKEEQDEINRINENMKETAIKYLSESEREQKVILENLKSESSKITAEQAAEVVKNSVKQKEETVKEAEQQYKDAVKNAQMQRDEMGIITDDQYKRIVEDAKKTREETVKNAEDMHTNVVGEAKKQAGEHVAQVEWETGEVKSKWQVMKQDVSKRMKEIGTDIKRDWTQAYNDTNKWVGDMASKVDTKFQAMGKNVGIKMNEAKDAVVKKWTESVEFLKSIDLGEIAKDVVEGFVIGIHEKIARVKEAAQRVASSVTDTVKDVLQIRSPARKQKNITEFSGMEGVSL